MLVQRTLRETRHALGPCTWKSVGPARRRNQPSERTSQGTGMETGRACRRRLVGEAWRACHHAPGDRPGDERHAARLLRAHGGIGRHTDAHRGTWRQRCSRRFQMWPSTRGRATARWPGRPRATCALASTTFTCRRVGRRTLCAEYLQEIAADNQITGGRAAPGQYHQGGVIGMWTRPASGTRRWTTTSGRSSASWAWSSEPPWAGATTTSVWTHPMARTLHAKSLDWFAVSEDTGESTSAKAHDEPTRSDHKPVLFAPDA